MKTYESFINERNEFKHYSNDELEIFRILMLYEVNKLDESLKTEIISNFDLNEGIRDKANAFRQKLFKMKDKISGDAKVAWDSIKKNVKAAVNTIKSIISGIKEGFNKIKTYCEKTLIKGLTSSKDFVEKTKSMEWTTLDDEMKNLAEFIKYISSPQMLNLLLKNIKESLIGLFTKKGEHVEIALESLDNLLFENEGNIAKPTEIFVKLIKFLEKLPPFNWLNNLAHAGSKNLQKIIDILNKVIKQFGGPELVIPTLITLLGLGFEYSVKSLTKAGIITLAPGIGTVLYAISYIAIFISTVHAIDAIIGHKILGSH